MIDNHFYIEKQILTFLIVTSGVMTVFGGIGVLVDIRIQTIVFVSLGGFGCFRLKKYLPMITGSEVCETRFSPLPRCLVPHGSKELTSEMYEELDQKSMHDATRDKMHKILSEQGMLTIRDAVNLYFYDNLVHQPGERRSKEEARKEFAKAQILGHDHDHL